MQNKDKKHVGKHKKSRNIPVEIKRTEKESAEETLQLARKFSPLFLNDETDLSELSEALSTRAPVLDKIAEAPEMIVGGRRFETPTQTNNSKDSDPFKYSIGGGNGDDEKKYIMDTGTRGNIPEQVDFERIGRTREDVFRQEGFFTSSERTANGNSNVERYSIPERFDEGRERKESHDPFSKKEKKYEPKLP
ncbi:MAG: hypothetical protein AABW63_01720 [Nanoarchaeota archaeon]